MLKMRVGHRLLKDVQDVPGKSISFYAEDGRTMFEVTVGSDGRSIEVRGVDNCIVDGVLHSNFFHVVPRAANSVTILCPKYEERE